MSELIGSRPEGISFYKPGDEITLFGGDLKNNRSFVSENVHVGDLGIAWLIGNEIEDVNFKDFAQGFLPDGNEPQIRLIRDFEQVGIYQLLLFLDRIPDNMHIESLVVLPNGKWCEAHVSQPLPPTLPGNFNVYNAWGVDDQGKPLYLLARPDTDLLSQYKFSFKMRLESSQGLTA